MDGRPGGLGESCTGKWLCRLWPGGALLRGDAGQVGEMRIVGKCMRKGEVESTN